MSTPITEASTDADAQSTNTTPPVPTPPPTTPPATEESGSGAHAEAAKRRVQNRELKETVAERDATIASQVETIAANAETIAGLRRTIVEQAIAADDSLPFLHRPADLWDIAGVDVATVFDDAGAIDSERLSEALTAFQTDRPYLVGERPFAAERHVLATLYGNQGNPIAGESNGQQAAVKKLTSFHE